MAFNETALEQAAEQFEAYLRQKRLEQEARRTAKDMADGRYKDQLAKHVQHPPGSHVHAGRPGDWR